MLQRNDWVFLEIARLSRGTFYPETRRIIKRQHLDFVDRWYGFNGFAVDLDESRGDGGFRTIGLVFEQQDRKKQAYVLYSDKIQYPLLHWKEFGGVEIGSNLLYGEGRNSSPLQRMDPGKHPLLQLKQRFEETDYRTGLPCKGRFALPSVLNDQEKPLYAGWLARLEAS